MSEFDKFSSRYTEVLDKDLKLSGESTEYFARYKAEYLYRCLGPDFEGSIVDYGCGVGLVTKFLRAHYDSSNVKIFGYDISKSSIIEARENVKDVQFTNDLEELKGRRFDAVIVANVLHHVKEEDRELFLKETKALLDKDGYLFVFEHNPYNPLTRYVVKRSVIDKDAVLIRLKDTVKLFRAAGIQVCEKRYITFFPKILSIFRVFEPMLGDVPLGAQYICTGKAL